jgi:hypothetical protein
MSAPRQLIAVACQRCLSASCQTEIELAAERAALFSAAVGARDRSGDRLTERTGTNGKRGSG